MLTMRQRDIYDLIRAYRRREGLSPTSQEISRRFGGLSQAAVHEHVNAQQAKGLIRTERKRTRSIELLKVGPDAVAVPCEANGLRIPEGARFVPVEVLDGLFAAWLRRRGLMMVRVPNGEPIMPGRRTPALGGLGKNDQEKWLTDQRIPELHQLPDRFYTRDGKAFDKGHIVRREDVCWGRSYAQIRRANGDTFHTTNCAPQVLGFNRAPGDWGRLENYILSQAVGDGDKFSIFAGPVFRDDDGWFEGVDDHGPVRVQIPASYWKIVVARSDGTLRSWAFMLEQDLAGVPLEEEFAVGAEWRDHLVGLNELEEMLGIVTFPGVLREAEQSGTELGEEALRSTESVRWTR